MSYIKCLGREFGSGRTFETISGETWEILEYLIPLEYETDRIVTAADDLITDLKYGSGFDETLPEMHLSTDLGRQVIIDIHDEDEFEELTCEMVEILENLIEYLSEESEAI